MLSDRITFVIQQTDNSITNFSNQLGINDATIRDLMKDRVKNISGELAIQIQRIYGINAEWLILGEGEMFLSSHQGGYTPPPDPTAQLKGKDKESARDYIEYLGDKPKIKEYKENEQEFKDWLATRQKELTPLPKIDIKEIEERVKFPSGRMAEVGLMYGRVAAGHPAEIFETKEPKKTYHIDKLLLGINDTKDIFALEVKGDSMMGAGIFKEDIVVFKPVYSLSELKNKAIVLASIDGELTLKRIIKDKQPYTLKAENPKYSDIELRTDQHIIVAKFLLLISGKR